MEPVKSMSRSKAKTIVRSPSRFPVIPLIELPLPEELQQLKRRYQFLPYTYPLRVIAAWSLLLGGFYLTHPITPLWFLATFIASCYFGKIALREAQKTLGDQIRSRPDYHHYQREMTAVADQLQKHLQLPRPLNEIQAESDLCFWKGDQNAPLYAFFPYAHYHWTGLWSLKPNLGRAIIFGPLS